MWYISIVGGHVPFEGHLKYIILCPPHSCKLASLARALLNNKNSFDLIFLVKFHHHQVLTNGQFKIRDTITIKTSKNIFFCFGHWVHNSKVIVYHFFKPIFENATKNSWCFLQWPPNSVLGIGQRMKHKS